MAPTKVQAEPEYAKYLDKEPTALMDHITDWLLTKTGFDPDSCESMEDAFAMGVNLTVALRPMHQASPENQERLEANRLAAEAEDKARAERRAEREAAREQRAEEAANKPKARRGRPPKAASETAETAEPVPATPRRRGRPPKAAASVETPENVTPLTGRRGRKSAAAAKATPVATETAEAAPERPRTGRRRAAKRDGEAAF